MSNKKKLIFSIVLIFSLILIGVSAFLITEAMKEKGATVIVTVNGNPAGVYSLSTDGTYTLNGGTNTLVIENGKAYVMNANCPDKLCVHQGKISKTGERIICLPNRLEISVKGTSDEILPN